MWDRGVWDCTWDKVELWDIEEGTLHVGSTKGRCGKERGCMWDKVIRYVSCCMRDEVALYWVVR